MTNRRKTRHKDKHSNRNYNRKNPVAYQNKDIVSKIFGERLKNKSLSVYGINIPRILEVHPTNLPEIEANELRVDNLFRLEDNSFALIDYESTYDYKDKIKYLSYVVRTLKRNSLVDDMEHPVRMIVIYTGNITPDQTRHSLDIGCLQFTVEEAFLSALDAAEIEANLDYKMKNNCELTEEEQMQFIILPLIYQNLDDQRKCIKRCFALVKQVNYSVRVQTFLLSGMLVFCDKIIPEEDANNMRRWIPMTKIGRMLEEEKQQAVKEAVARAEKETAERVEKETAERVEKETAARVEKEITVREEKERAARAEDMLRRGLSAEDVLASILKLSREDLDKLMAAGGV